MRRTHISFEFVAEIPREIEDGLLYISTQYAIAVHKCCCGCGSKVATQLSPSGWRIIFDGESVSLDPSVGNWSFPCQSHYWIQRDSVVWESSLSAVQIARVRRNRDKEKLVDIPLVKRGFGHDRADDISHPKRYFWRR